MRLMFLIPVFLLFSQLLNAQANDSVGVIKTIEAFKIALGKGDARSFADLFTQDADFTNVVDC